MSAALHFCHLAEKQDAVAVMAARANVSRRLMFLAIKARRHGCAEVFSAVMQGRLTASLAAELVDLFPNHEDQRTMLGEFAAMPERQWRGFARRVAALMRSEAQP